ncbi:calcium-binding protein [Actinoplanes oblitus]|uniref:Calcium-binding protein n=1 Tax=Actinoplanes oblitus TaxID=3040509 RepID=A0ABY8WKT9_9ACTN|nr:calcium-binding protein [Actinoplanes oblitus]WIM96360.1 calcium-binding protein [Actinoplanes oblitus]
MRRKLWPVGSGLALLSVLASGAFAGPAAAASYGDATAGAHRITFTADYGVTNKIVITRSGRTVTIDDRVEIRPGKGCKRVTGDKTRVRCKTTKATTLVIVKVNDRNDSVVNNSDLRMEADGGPGNDRIVGGPKADILWGDQLCPSVRGGNDRIYGRGGNDEIYAEDGSDYVSAGDGDDQISGDNTCGGTRKYPGNDVLHGDNGNDWVVGYGGNDRVYGDNGNDSLLGEAGRDYLSGGAGADWMRGDASDRAVAADVLLGGSGPDRVDYYHYRKAVTVDLDGASGDDGLPGEHDTVGADVEGIDGTGAADRLTGNGAANQIDGYGGNDVIRGGGGDDHLNGEDGTDRIFGEGGNDTLGTWSPLAVLDGGPDSDICQGRPETAMNLCEDRQIW